MWAYGEIGYHTGLMSRYSEFKSRYAYKESEFFLWKKQHKIIEITLGKVM